MSPHRLSAVLGQQLARHPVEFVEAETHAVGMKMAIDQSGHQYPSTAIYDLCCVGRLAAHRRQSLDLAVFNYHPVVFDVFGAVAVEYSAVFKYGNAHKKYSWQELKPVPGYRRKCRLSPRRIRGWSEASCPRRGQDALFPREGWKPSFPGRAGCPLSQGGGVLSFPVFFVGAGMVAGFVGKEYTTPG